MVVVYQFIIGLLFGLGLVIAGMSDPAKVANFLDLNSIRTGKWDPSLMLVLASAVSVTFVGYMLVLRRSAPVFDQAFHLPSKEALDARIVFGPAIFGVGWGLSGFCPGPAFTALSSGQAATLYFFFAMITGMLAARWLDKAVS